MGMLFIIIAIVIPFSFYFIYKERKRKKEIKQDYPNREFAGLDEETYGFYVLIKQINTRISQLDDKAVRLMRNSPEVLKEISHFCSLSKDITNVTTSQVSEVNHNELQKERVKNHPIEKDTELDDIDEKETPKSTGCNAFNEAPLENSHDQNIQKARNNQEVTNDNTHDESSEYFLQFPDRHGFFWNDKKTTERQAGKSAFLMKVDSSSKEASVTFLTDDNKIVNAALSNLEFLEPVCDISGDKGKTIEVIKKGTLFLRSDKWVVNRNERIKLKIR